MSLHAPSTAPSAAPASRLQDFKLDGATFTCDSAALAQAAGIHAVDHCYTFGDISIPENDTKRLLEVLVRSGVISSDGKKGIKSNELDHHVTERAVAQYFARLDTDKRRVEELRQKLNMPEEVHGDDEHGHGHDHHHGHEHSHDHHHGPAYEKNHALLERRLTKLQESGWSPHGENGGGKIGVKIKAAYDWTRSWLTTIPLIGLETARKAEREVSAHDRKPVNMNPEAFRAATANINLEGNSPHSPLIQGTLKARHWAQKWDSHKKRWSNDVRASVGSLRIKCKGDRYTMCGYVGHYPHAKLRTITVRHYEDLYMAGLTAGMIEPDENFFAGSNSQQEAHGMINYMSMNIWRQRIQEMATQTALVQTYLQSTGNPSHLTYHEIFDISKLVRQKIENYIVTSKDRLLSPEDFREAILTNSGAFGVIDDVTKDKKKAAAQKSWLRYFLTESVGDSADTWIHDTSPEGFPDRVQAPLDGDKRWNYWDFLKDINQRMEKGDLDTEEGDMLTGLVGHLSVLDKKQTIGAGSLIFIGGVGRFAKGTIMAFEHGIKVIHDGCTMDERKEKFEHSKMIYWKDVAGGLTSFLEDELHIHDKAGLGYIAGQVGHLQGKVNGTMAGRKLLVDVLQNEAAALFRYKLSEKVMKNVINGSALYGWWDGNGLGGINSDTVKLIMGAIEARIKDKPVGDNHTGDMKREKITHDIVSTLIRQDAFRNNTKPDGSGGITVAEGAKLLESNIQGFVETYITDDFIL